MNYIPLFISNNYGCNYGLGKFGLGLYGSSGVNPPGLYPGVNGGFLSEKSIPHAEESSISKDNLLNIVLLG